MVERRVDGEMRLIHPQGMGIASVPVRRSTLEMHLRLTRDQYAGFEPGLIAFLLLRARRRQKGRLVEIHTLAEFWGQHLGDYPLTFHSAPVFFSHGMAFFFRRAERNILQERDAGRFRTPAIA